MSRRTPPAAPPRVVRARLAGRTVAELAVAPDGGIVPGSLLWCRDPAAVSGPDRERLAAEVVRLAGLDPKADFERVYAALWDGAPKRG